MKMFAIVWPPKGTQTSRQKVGLPPQLTGGVDCRFSLPWPCVVVIDKHSTGVFLNRFAMDGAFAGNTWHMTVADAKEQAEDEYGGSLGEWREIPPEINDRLNFVLAAAKRVLTE